MVNEIEQNLTDIQQISDTLISMRHQEEKTYNNVDYFKTQYPKSVKALDDPVVRK